MPMLNHIILILTCGWHLQAVREPVIPGPARESCSSSPEARAYQRGNMQSGYQSVAITNLNYSSSSVGLVGEKEWYTMIPEMYGFG